MSQIILSAKSDDQNTEQLIYNIVQQMPIMIQEEAQKALLAEYNGNTAEALAGGLKLLDLCCDKTMYEIRMMVGRCYFTEMQLHAAEQVFRDLSADFPEQEEPKIYEAMLCHAQGDYAEAYEMFASLYPPQKYHPFFYNAYADSLQHMGKTKQAREIFYQEISHYLDTKTIVSAEMLDGTFQNVLYLDVILQNQKYDEDLAVYLDFLHQIDMNEKMQGYLLGTLSHLSTLMRNKWYRPKFIEFLDQIKKYLPYEKYKQEIDCAHASYESYLLHDDFKVNIFMETYLSAQYNVRYTLNETGILQEKNRMMAEALTYQWYLCQCFAEYIDVFEYIRKAYPYSYNLIEYQVRDMEQNGTEKVADKILDNMLPYAQNVSRSELEKSMYEAYEKAVLDIKTPHYIYDSVQSYKRQTAKVGRNDPCPCGSGRKYKKCCGK